MDVGPCFFVHFFIYNLIIFWDGLLIIDTVHLTQKKSRQNPYAWLIFSIFNLSCWGTHAWTQQRL